jgi:TolB-like protein/Tfp pilus assembly protein PilF
MEHKNVVFRFSDIEALESDFVLTKAGAPVAVEPKAFRVLLFLLRNAGRLVTKEEILTAVWNDCSVSDNSLTRSVATLRRMLGDDTRQPRYIATIPTLEYRFICPVTVSEESLSTLGAARSSKSTSAAAVAEAMTEASLPFSQLFDSIAVLPFANGGGGEEMEYLSDGIATGLINNLSHLQSLRVIPCATTFHYRGKLSDAVRAGREVRVQVVLTGQIARYGKDLIVTAELIDTVRELHLWEATYRSTIEDIFPAQAEIAAEVTNRLQMRLNDEERSQLSKRPTEIREAYYLYLKATHWASKWTPDAMRKSFDYIGQALDADPTYAHAWSTLAYLYLLTGIMGGSSPSDTFPRARAAALKALEIDSKEADAHAALAFVKLIYDWDWQGSRRDLLRAIEMNPNLATAHYFYSIWYVSQGLYAEAAHEARLALDVDPLSVSFSYLEGFISYCAGKYDQAIEELSRAVDLYPLFAPTHQFLAYAYARKGMRNEAVAAIERCSEGTNSASRAEILRAIVDAQTGKPAEARIVLKKLTQELKPPDFTPAYHCAVLHALLGEVDESFDCLEMARQGRSVTLMYLAIVPNLESLHGDIRFREMLRYIGIPVQAV